MKSLETMVKEQIEAYMRPIPAYKFNGFSLEVAAKKVKAARNFQWDDIVDRVYNQMRAA